MSNMVDTFHALLRDHRKSVTAARTMLFMYLQNSGPVTPHQFLHDNASVADRASLYRSLQLFKDLGVVEERLTGGRRVVELTDRYDAHHHHFSCTRCNKSYVITMPAIESALEKLCAAQGFVVEGHVIEVTGRCANCNAVS